MPLTGSVAGAGALEGAGEDGVGAVGGAVEVVDPVVFVGHFEVVDGGGGGASGGGDVVGPDEVAVLPAGAGAGGLVGAAVEVGVGEDLVACVPAGDGAVDEGLLAGGVGLVGVPLVGGAVEDRADFVGLRGLVVGGGGFVELAAVFADQAVELLLQRGLRRFAGLCCWCCRAGGRGGGAQQCRRRYEKAGRRRDPV